MVCGYRCKVGRQLNLNRMDEYTMDLTSWQMDNGGGLIYKTVIHTVGKDGRWPYGERMDKKC